MAELRTIARPYAEAAFGLARQESALAQWSEALAGMATAVSAPEMASLLGNPGLTSARLAELIASAVPALSPSQKQMLLVLIDNERLAAMAEISAMFDALRNDAEQVLSAEVTSAYPLSDAQTAEIAGLLEKKHGKKVSVSVMVDPSLIGGVSIAIGDEVLDASVRGKLARMQSALMN